MPQLRSQSHSLVTGVVPDPLDSQEAKFLSKNHIDRSWFKNCILRMRDQRGLIKSTFKKRLET